MFQEVSFRDLVPGQKYKIKYELVQHTFNVGIYKGNWEMYDEFENVHRYTMVGDKLQKYLSKDTYFNRKVYYQFIPQKDKIQQAMEKRALVQVLSKIGIYHFDW
jgi:hypothetical protein